MEQDNDNDGSEFVFSEEPFKERLDQLIKAIEGESKRAQILILTAHLDDLLEQMLMKFLKPRREKKDELFGRTRPLSSFSSHISAAYRMGLISKTDADALDLLREIRNECAHSMTEFDLRSQEGNFQKFNELVSRSGDRVFLLCACLCPKTEDDAAFACCFILIVSFEKQLLTMTEVPSLQTSPLFEKRESPEE